MVSARFFKNANPILYDRHKSNFERISNVPAVRHTDVQLRARFYGLSRLPSHNGTQERLTDADDPVRNCVAAVVVHVLLLLVKRADRRDPGSFPFGKNPAQSELFFNGGKVSREIA